MGEGGRVGREGRVGEGEDSGPGCEAQHRLIQSRLESRQLSLSQGRIQRGRGERWGQGGV